VKFLLKWAMQSPERGAVMKRLRRNHTAASKRLNRNVKRRKQ
jgi:hypothetical protein